MTSAPLLHGVFPAITTPFYPDGRVYYRKLEHNVDRYSRTPIAGMVVLGSTAEAIMLSQEEQREVLREACAATSPEKVLIAGTGAESVIETLRLTEYAAELGYDAALVRTPHYYRPQMKPENMLTFYRTVADRSPLPVLLYTVPVFTAYDLPLELVSELSEHPNIVGIKESGGSLEKIKRLAAETQRIQRQATVTEIFTAVTGRMLKRLEKGAQNGNDLVPATALAGTAATATTAKPKIKTRSKEVGFQVMAGTAQQLLPSLEAGAVGAVLAFAACAPTACYEIYTAWKERDPELAQEKQQRIVEAARRVVGEFGIPGVKYALDLNGYYGGHPRMPLLPLTAAQRAEVERHMESIRN
ncbi:MAG: dihydrodipicolinate synthase family protein [Acidobacteriales bacterium]|nr:dihydrodipicolinate synthase family protein [Terriglobales bacterium]